MISYIFESEHKSICKISTDSVVTELQSGLAMRIPEDEARFLRCKDRDLAHVRIIRLLPKNSEFLPESSDSIILTNDLSGNFIAPIFEGSDGYEVHIPLWLVYWFKLKAGDALDCKISHVKPKDQVF